MLSTGLPEPGLICDVTRWTDSECDMSFVLGLDVCRSTTLVDAHTTSSCQEGLRILRYETPHYPAQRAELLQCFFPGAFCVVLPRCYWCVWWHDHLMCADAQVDVSRLHDLSVGLKGKVHVFADATLFFRSATWTLCLLGRACTFSQVYLSSCLS